MGAGRKVNLSLTRTECGSTAFGCPRWEQPRADLRDQDKRMAKRLHAPRAPTSPLRRFRRPPSELHGAMGPYPSFMLPSTHKLPFHKEGYVRPG